MDDGFILFFCWFGVPIILSGALMIVLTLTHPPDDDGEWRNPWV
jgi:hypothetical protein